MRTVDLSAPSNRCPASAGELATVALGRLRTRALGRAARGGTCAALATRVRIDLPRPVPALLALRQLGLGMGSAPASLAVGLLGGAPLLVRGLAALGVGAALSLTACGETAPGQGGVDDPGAASGGGASSSSGGASSSGGSSGGSSSSGSSGDAGKTDPVVSVLAPRAAWDETRRLLRAIVSDERGLAGVTVATNGGAARALRVDGAPKSLVVAEALDVRPGDNTAVVVATSVSGGTRTETLAFHVGLRVTGGGSHSGAVVAAKLYTWGRYNLGQLGLGGETGDAQSKTSPQLVTAFGAAPVASLAFNQNSSVAVESDGTVWVWGANESGQLGLGDATLRAVPTQVPGLADAVLAASGFSHTLVLKKDGTVVAFGHNGAGQVGVAGNGTNADTQPSPVTIAGLPKDIVKVAAGSSTSAALGADGRVWTWGQNASGTLGLGAADDARHATPTVVPGLANVVDVAMGRDHVLAVDAAGRVRAWGLGQSGQLGYGDNTNPDTANRAAPVPVVRDTAGTPLGDVRAVLANGNTSYAVLSSGAYWGWGQNFSGQIALGKTSTSEPVPVRGALYSAQGATPRYLDEVTPLTALAAGGLHTVARGADGKVYVWGWNSRGSLGVPALENNWAQVQPLTLTLP